MLTFRSTSSDDRTASGAAFENEVKDDISSNSGEGDGGAKESGGGTAASVSRLSSAQYLE